MLFVTIWHILAAQLIAPPPEDNKENLIYERSANFATSISLFSKITNDTKSFYNMNIFDVDKLKGSSCSRPAECLVNEAS